MSKFNEIGVISYIYVVLLQYIYNGKNYVWIVGDPNKIEPFILQPIEFTHEVFYLCNLDLKTTWKSQNYHLKH